MVIAAKDGISKGLPLLGKALVQHERQRQTQIHHVLCNNTPFRRYMCDLSSFRIRFPNPRHLARIQPHARNYASAMAEVGV